MQSTVAFLMTVLLVTTPATQVLAQTPHKQDVQVRQADVSPAKSVVASPTLGRGLTPKVPSLRVANPLDAPLPSSQARLAVPLASQSNDGPVPTSVKVVAIVLIVAVVVAAIELTGAFDDFMDYDVPVVY